MTPHNIRVLGLSELISLVESAKHQDAIDLGRSLLAINHGDNNSIISYLSLAYYGLGDVSMAVACLSQNFSRGHESIDDLHRACEYSLIMREYKECELFASKLISKFPDDKYYLSNTYLMRAYSKCKMGDISGAKKDLLNIEDDEEAITWLRGIPNISRSQIEDHISDGTAV